jgi:NAD+ kinase
MRSSAPPSTEAKPVTRACVMTHGRSSTVGDGVQRLQRVAAERGVELVFEQLEIAKHGLGDAAGLLHDGRDEGIDVVIVLGGDGTTLRALNRFLCSGIPVFAVNYGRVGFLTTASARDLETAVARAFAGEYRVVELPTVEALRGGARVGVAVNDAVFTSDVHGRIAHFRWWVDDVRLGEIGCDAVVVATPSGSTAYSLSAGGPVLSWGLDGVCVTFVAPHSLTARSLVLPRGETIRVENRGEGLAARLVLDGQPCCMLPPGDRIEVRMAPELARLAFLPEVAFLQRFRDTFGID